MWEVCSLSMWEVCSLCGRLGGSMSETCSPCLKVTGPSDFLAVDRTADPGSLFAAERSRATLGRQHSVLGRGHSV